MKIVGKTNNNAGSDFSIDVSDNGLVNTLCEFLLQLVIFTGLYQDFVNILGFN